MNKLTEAVKTAITASQRANAGLQREIESLSSEDKELLKEQYGIWIDYSNDFSDTIKVVEEEGVVGLLECVPLDCCDPCVFVYGLVDDDVSTLTKVRHILEREKELRATIQHKLNEFRTSKEQKSAEQQQQLAELTTFFENYKA